MMKKTLKKWLRPALCVLLAAAALVCGLRFHRLTNLLDSQQAAKRFRGENEQPFAQVSVFLNTQGITKNEITAFRQTLDAAYVDASLEAGETGSLYQDGWCGMTEVTVKGPAGEGTVKTMGVGGEYFAFHPLRLRSGAYLSERDFMQDHVVLDEALAWQLFGSGDVAGLEVTIGDRNYLVSGVVAREDDFATGLAFTDTGILYMSYDALNDMEALPITAYELAAANPVRGFVKNLVTDKFPVGDGLVVENSSRYTANALLHVMLDFGKRSMQTHAVILPYWENAARLLEDYAAALLLATVLFAVYPAVQCSIWLIRFVKKKLLQIKDTVQARVEARVEKKKEENYVPGGI